MFSLKNAVLFLGLVLFSFSSCIKEDDGVGPDLNLPQLNIESVTINEDDTDVLLDIPVTLTGTNTTNVVASFAVVDGAAAATVDYEVLTTGKLIFAEGETQKIIQVRIFGDEIQEPAETFKIQLFNITNATYINDICIVTIADDDDPTAGFTIPTGGYTTPLDYAGKTLVWSDEFEGDSLDMGSWTFEEGAGGWGNQELQHYRTDNLNLQDGFLVITAKKQNFGNSQYTSSRIITKGKKQFKYGRIDVRAALPEGQGLWPAIWMLGSNIDAVSWPACGEIDIMELTGNLPNRTLSTIHYGASVAEHRFKGNSLYLPAGENFQDEFHVFSLNWENNLMEFMVDDEVFYTVTPATLDGAAYPFNKFFFFVMNVAVGGELPGDPDQTTPFPQRMIVDYVRVFQ